MFVLSHCLLLPAFVTRHLFREDLLTTCGLNLSNSLISVSMDAAGQRRLGWMAQGNDTLFKNVVGNTITTL